MYQSTLEKSTFSKHLRLLIPIVSACLVLLTGAGLAFADTTPDTCDITPKYYCAHIDYSNDGVTASSITRWYEGAIDGGAKGYYRYWAADWTWNGSSWSQVASYGSDYNGAWYTDANLGNWKSITGGTIAQSASMTLRMVYWETQSASPGYYYWCSQIEEHHMYDNTSTQWGTSQC